MEWRAQIMLTREMQQNLNEMGDPNLMIKELVNRMVEQIISTSQISLTRESDPFTNTSTITLKFKPPQTTINT